MSNHNQMPNPHQEIADLVDMNRANQPIRPDGNVMSRSEVEQITANQDQIRGDVQEEPTQSLNPEAQAALERLNKAMFGDEQTETPAEEQSVDSAEAKQQARNDALDTLNKLIRTKKPLDGPTLNGAGIGFMKQQELGFGSFDAMQQAAAERRSQLARDRREAKKAEEAAAQAAADEAAAKAAQEAEEQRIKDYHAANDAKAAEWQAETAAWRDGRQKADERIDNLVDGSAATEGMSYKERLEMGGERGVKLHTEASKMNREDAIAQAAAEGHSVAHTETRHHQVVRNETAEAEAAKTAAALKEFHAQIFGGASREAAPADAPDSPDAPADVEPLVSRPDAGVVIENGAATRTPESLVEGATRTRAFLGRMKDKLMAKGIKLTNAVSDAVTSRFAGKFETGTLDEVTLRRNQRMLTGAIAGAALVYLSTRLGGAELPFFGGGSGMAQAANEHGAGGHDALSVLTDHGGKHGGAHNHDALSVLSGHTGNGGHEQVQETVTLKSGDTVWGEADKALGGHATNAQIDQVKDAILQQNGISEGQATHLSVGTELNMPTHLIEHIEEEAKKAKAA